VKGLRVDSLSHAFGGLRAVSGFTLAAEQGELVGLIGPNGAGKTTVFNLLTGVYRPDAGSIRLDGRELTGLPPHRIASLGVARTFQNIRLFSQLSVIDNVRAGFYATGRESIFSALLRLPGTRVEERAGVKRAEELLECFGLRAYAHEEAGSLPYGMQRRLEVARALAAAPRVLLLDEPAAGMNPAEIRQMMQFIRWVRDEFNLAVVLIEHQMALVMGVCERIVVLDSGETIAAGTPDEIRRHPAVLSAYLGSDHAAALG
jgi:branched-chain amino acid transport system ATP-binding protein